MVHKSSGTFAEIIEAPIGLCLSFTIRSNGKWYVSKSEMYNEDEILIHWRYAEQNEVKMYNMGKLSIK